MPGKHVKVGHIDAIPEATGIGPFRNVVIHTGINSINNQRYRQSNVSLVKTLESKIQNINTTYPKSKIYVSLLLPSRSVSLNRRIRDFNNLILDMTYRLNSVSVIDNSIFGELLTDEHGRWMPSGDNSNEFVPKISDLLHLGKHGIRQFVMNIKKSVIGKRKPQSRERFDGGRGGFRRAAERGLTHQRGGHNRNMFSPLADLHDDDN